MCSNVILQLVISLSGIILPPFFIRVYGSPMNGMIATITQFITYMSLVEAGIGMAAIISLYKPLAKKDERQINRVLSGAKNFYQKSGILFVILVLGMLVFYPMMQDKIASDVVRFMILILAGSGVVDFFFLGKYRVLLSADQRNYVISIAQTIGNILNVAVSIYLIELGTSVLLVKLIATLVYVLRFFIIYSYVKKRYHYINFKEAADNSAFKQRWDVLAHQICGMVVGNTDMILISALGGNNAYAEVSVYSIYNMVGYALSALMQTFNNGLTAGFGEVISTGNEEVLSNSYSNYEYMFFLVQSICYVCMGILIMPFMSVYTQKLTDANYIRPVVAMLFCFIGFAQTIRNPGITIISAAGHYKETRNRAIIEAVIKLSVSLLLIYSYGMIGVLIGTVCSFLYRSIDVLIYTGKYLVPGSLKRTGQRIARNVIIAGTLFVGAYYLMPQKMDNFIQWTLYAMITGIFTVLVYVGVNYFFEPEQCRLLISRIKTVLSKKGRIS